MTLGSKPVWVEMFGLPGAGKSTLARGANALMPLLTRGELSTDWRSRSAVQKASFLSKALQNRHRTLQAISLAWRAPLTSRDSLLRLSRLVVKSHWLPTVAEGRLLEEGLLQDLWSILYSSRRWDPDPQLLSSVLRSIYSSADARIVHIAVSPQTAASRIAGRSHGKSRFDTAAEAEVCARLDKAARLSDCIIQAAATVGIQTSVLDGSMPLPQLISELRWIIEEAAP